MLHTLEYIGLLEASKSGRKCRTVRVKRDAISVIIPDQDGHVRVYGEGFPSGGLLLAYTTDELMEKIGGVLVQRAYKVLSFW